MRVYQVYRDIRRGAVIFGLSLPYFAIMLLSIIVSLLVIIFSFGFAAIVVTIFWNTTVYAVLLRFHNRPGLLGTSGRFPCLISNKKTSGLCYEED